ncbi:MAG: hypothetical protein AAFO58_09520, partial [Pseudomonadota bacterium]
FVIRGRAEARGQLVFHIERIVVVDDQRVGKAEIGDDRQGGQARAHGASTNDEGDSTVLIYPYASGEAVPAAILQGVSGDEVGSIDITFRPYSELDAAILAALTTP